MRNFAMRFHILLSCFLFSFGRSKDDGVIVEHPNCRLYLAESTIPNAGLGIFTGTDLQEGDPVAEPDIVVPLADYDWHAGEDLDFWFLWEDYSWDPMEAGMNFDMSDGHALVIGTGCMPNCNFALINAAEGKPDYDHAGLHRSEDVGISGFTGFYNQRMFATRTVPAGGELFANYGEEWFMNRAGHLGAVPFNSSYKRVDKFLKKFKKMSLKHQNSDSPDFTKDFWDIVKSTSYDTRNSNALPLSFEDMQSAQTIGSAETRLPHSVRTLDWLNKHGRCMDNIRPGNSTIRQAGRGAFASRKIPMGGIVAPGPLLHIANRTALNLYDVAEEDGTRDTTKHVGMQLILNYCFGHKQSTVILCPYTSPSAYINHNSESPNAKIVWAQDSTPNHNSGWLEEDVNFLKTINKSGLSINFIATRDIQPGEEVFIAYGPEWENAWTKYQKEWSPSAGSDKYVPSSAVQEPLRTATEQLSHPYPDNIVFYCNYITSKLESSEGTWVWEDGFRELPLYPCRVVSREAGDAEIAGYSYTMAMLSENEYEENIIHPVIGIPSGENHILANVPRWAIKVRDKAYTKDEFVKNPFRHEMMVPSEIFPETWKNL